MTRIAANAATDEQALIERARDGDQAAMAELLAANQDRVFAACLRLLRNRDDAMEIAQDAMVKAIQKLDTFQGGSKFSTWITRIAMNLSISRIRRQQVRKAASLDQSSGNPGDDGAALRHFLENHKEPTPDQRVESDEQIARLREAMDSLDESVRMMIVLRDLQGMEYQEMAEVLDVPVGTVKSRLFRARVALRETIEAMEQTPLESNR